MPAEAREEEEEDKMGQVRHLGSNGQLGAVPVILIAQGAALLFKALGDKCKRGCDIKHLFNKTKRRTCKCQCAVSNPGTTYTPPGGETCEGTYGVTIPTVIITDDPGGITPPLSPTKAAINPLLLIGIVGAGIALATGGFKFK